MTISSSRLDTKDKSNTAREPGPTGAQPLPHAVMTHPTHAAGGMSGNSTNASSAGSSGRSSRAGSRLLRRPASEAAAAAGAGPLGVELAAAADEAQDAARIAAAAHVDYPAEERAMLAQAAAIACDQLEVTRAGPSFVQSGLSPFGRLLAVWREPSVAAGAVGAGRAGVDVWAGVTAHGYIVLWSQGDGSNASAAAAPATPSVTSAVETRLVDFEKFLSDSYRSLTAATFTMPKLLPGAGGKRGTLTFFVLTEEGHGLTFAVDLGVLLTAAATESEEEDAALPVAAAPVAAGAAAPVASEGSRRVGIVGHRRLLLRKALFPRDLPAGSGFASVSHAALASSTHHTLAYHALSNCILLSVDSDLYAYSDANLHTVWQASVGPAILGSSAVSVAAHGGTSSSTPEEKKAASVAAAAAVASSAQRMDAKQRRTHAITSLAFPSVLSVDTPSLLVAMNALALAAGAAPFSLPNSQSAFHGQPPPPPFLVAGTKSGYLLRIELRRRDLGGSAVGAAAAGATGRVVPDVRVLARFQEHNVSHLGMGLPGEEDAHVTGEQRDELARKKEDERRKKAGGVAAAAAAASAAAAAASSVSSSSGIAASPVDDSATSSSATTPRGAFPLFKLGESGSGTSASSNAAAVAFDPTQFPPSPVLIGSPWFDPSPAGTAASLAAGTAVPAVRATAYGTSLTSVAVVLRRGEWLCVVGCADGFVHVVARDGARVYSDSNSPNQRAASQCKYASTSSAQSSPPHPVALDPAFPAALLFTLVDPCVHSTSARVAPVVRLVSSLDGGMIATIDASGVLRRWDLNQRCLAGRTHTEGVLHADDSAPRGSPLAGTAATAAATPAPFSAHMELIYAGAHSELAVLYGPGGPLAGLGGAASPLVRMHSRGTQGGSNGSSGGMSASDKEMTPAALLAAGLLLPSHVLIVCHTAFSLWRLQRMPRVHKSHPFALSLDFPGSVLSAAPSVLSELGAFIAAYQAEDRRIAEGYGVTQGEKLRLELSQSQSRSQSESQARDGRGDSKQRSGSAMASREEMASPDSLIYTPSPNAPLSPLSPGSGVAASGGGGSDGLLRTSSTSALLKGHHSIGATPHHPGLVEATSPDSAVSAPPHAQLVPSFALPPPQSEGPHGAVSGGDEQQPPTTVVDSTADFYGFAPIAAPSTAAIAVSPPTDNGASNQPSKSPPADVINPMMAEPRGPVEAKLSHLSIFSPHASASPSASASASPFPDSGGSGGSAQTIDADTPANLREASAQVLPAISVLVDVDPDDE